MSGGPQQDLPPLLRQGRLEAGGGDPGGRRRRLPAGGGGEPPSPAEGEVQGVRGPGEGSESDLDIFSTSKGRSTEDSFLCHSFQELPWRQDEEEMMVSVGGLM